MDIISGVVSADHVHLFVSIPPKLALSDFIWLSKGRSSFKVQQEFPDLKKRYWGRGYFSTTNGAITDDVILQYLESHIEKSTGASL